MTRIKNNKNGGIPLNASKINHKNQTKTELKKDNLKSPRKKGTMTFDSCSGSSAGYSEYTDLTYCEPPATSQGSTGLGICGLYGTANVAECF